MNSGSPNRWLVVAALTYSTVHHQGTLLADAGETIDRTRWADWIDLATPYVVLLPVAAALAAAGADRVAWALYAVGAITYVEGHGIHLSANSISNVAPTEGEWPPLVHLWDETVGHYFWSGGALLVALAVARAMRAQERPPAIAYVLALTVGATWFSNSIEGGTPILGIAGAALLALIGWRERARFGAFFMVAYGLALCLLVGFGIWQGGFPQFTELGWA